jgi:hypothetical protein
MSAPVLQFKRGNAGLAGTVPALRPGEPAISLNNFDLFVGIDTSVTNNKFFGSHRYWQRENGTNSLSLKLVDKDGSNSISLKSPNTLSGNGTYILPDTNTIVDGHFLKVSSDGQLSWETITSNASFSNASLSGITTISGTLDVNADSDFSGITTFSNTTDNTLGDADTGAVQIDGGLGVNKNVTVGANLYVQGYSEFIGVVTFRGGTLNLGDEDTDDINVAGEFISNLVPNTTNTYDIGIEGKGWRHANFTGVGTITTLNSTTGTITNISGVNLNYSGIGTFTNGSVINAIRIGISSASEIDTSSGDLILDSATGTTIIDDDLNVSGDVRINGNDVKSSTGDTVLTLSGDDATFASDLTVQGNLFVNGNTTQVNTASLTVEDRTIDLGFVGGVAPASSTTWDLGLLFNYHDGTGAKKSAVVWEYSTLRFQFANTLTSETTSSDVNNPQLVVATFAPIEIGALWVNDCAGQSQVISCTGSERFLGNITIDAGGF